MAKSIKSIEADALALDAEDRAKLVRRLVESLSRDPEIAEAWDAETERRVALFEAGEAELIPAEQVLAEARSRYKS